MNSRLVEILEEKRKEVFNLKKGGVRRSPEEEIPHIRDFRRAISNRQRLNLIAEIKFASPSAGSIREKTDPAAIGRIYEEAGVAAISLLTDKKFFSGDIKDLLPLRRATSLPVLRKDFIIDACQVEESRLFGADAILLISSILSRETLGELLHACEESGLAALTEVHNEEDLERALDSGAEIIGINNRDLNTFEVKLDRTLKLAPMIPKDRIIVSESGIHHGSDIRSLKGLGIQAVLVGSALMASDALAEKTKELVDAGMISRETG